MRGFLINLIKCILFFAGLAVLLAVCSRIMCPVSDSKTAGPIDQRAYAVLAEPEQTIDVLVLGDSVTYSSFIPMQLWENYGITSYCCGTPAQKLFYSEEFLKKAFENQSPKIVLLEANTLYRSSKKQDVVLHKLGNIFTVFIYHDRWKSMDISETMELCEKDIRNKGYRYDTTVIPTSSEGYMADSTETGKIINTNKKYVKGMKKFCEDRGAILVLYSVPSTVNWDMKSHNGVALFAEELDIPYVDLNFIPSEICIDWTHDTRDKGDHLNYYGAKKVTEYMGHFLANMEILADHRGDATYADWNLMLELFLSQVDDEEIQ